MAVVSSVKVHQELLSVCHHIWQLSVALESALHNFFEANNSPLLTNAGLAQRNLFNFL
jgi:hypothetical protein